MNSTEGEGEGEVPAAKLIVLLGFQFVCLENST